jgi:hypothetical protein
MGASWLEIVLALELCGTNRDYAAVVPETTSVIGSKAIATEPDGEVRDRRKGQTV